MPFPKWLFPRATNSSLPAPFSFAPSQTFDGDDGSWSTFTIRVGTPPQTFRVLPATNSDESWVPIPQGCNITGYPKDCGNLRGADPFQVSPSLGFDKSGSSTWVENGIFNLLMEENLEEGQPANGDYGFDIVGLEDSPSGPTLPHQVVAGIATNEFWLGYFGLGPKPVNFTAEIPSFMKNLADQNLIPSLSYGYTAGAKYHNEGALGSLTLGGYDNARHVSNNITFDFDANDSASLTVGLQSISATRTLDGTVTVLEAPGIYALIDSGVPEIWLPAASCEVFEAAFGLTYDNKTDRYLINNTMHSYIEQLNSSVTLTLGPQATGGPSVAIEMPYAAFDLQASFPLYPNTTNYFPIRRANSTQYTIGRAFLQEAYITVDYERSEFHVSQATFPNSGPNEIVAILSPNTTSSNSTHSGVSSMLSPGSIAGIALGAVAISLIGLCAFAYLFFRRRRKQKQYGPDRSESTSHWNGEWKPELPNNELKRPEVESQGPSNELKDLSNYLPKDSKQHADISNHPVHRSHDISIISPLSADRYTELESLRTATTSEMGGLPRYRHELLGSPTASELDHRRRSIYELPTDNEWMTELADSAHLASEFRR